MLAIQKEKNENPSRKIRLEVVGTIKQLEKVVPAVTGMKDLDLKIMNELSDNDLLSFSLVSKNTRNLCLDEGFWQRRLMKNFGSQFNPIKNILNKSWKNTYFQLKSLFNKGIVTDEKLIDFFFLILSDKVKIYYTHNNGSQPLRVLIDGNIVLVHNNNVFISRKSSKYRENKGIRGNYSIDELYVFKVEDIFVGKSPKTAISDTRTGGYGPKYDGNSILICLNELNYVFIGDCIYKFKACSKINFYLSPVGNNDVPYPYARDVENNTYLMLIEKGELSVIPGKVFDRYDASEPYLSYYDNTKSFEKQMIYLPITMIRNRSFF